jgi:ligand-binding sensor protein
MTPLDILTKNEWEEILDGFARKTGMTTCLGDEKGNPIQCKADRYPLCVAIRGNQESLTFICSQAATTMSAVIRKTIKPELDYCQAGLMRVAVPIVRNGETVGQIFACGVASEEEEIDASSLSKQLGISEDEVREAAKATPVGSEEEIESAAAELFHQVNAVDDRR